MFAKLISVKAVVVQLIWADESRWITSVTHLLHFYRTLHRLCTRRQKQGQLELGLGLSRRFRGRTLWIVDAHRDDGKRFIARSDEKLTAFLELQSAVCVHLLTDEFSD